MRYNLNITSKLTILFVLFTFLIVLGIASLEFNYGGAALQAATTSGLLSIALEKQAALDSWVDEGKSDITTLAANPNIIDHLEHHPFGNGYPRFSAEHDEMLNYLSQWAGPGKHFTTLLILDPTTAQVIAATDPKEEGKFAEDRPYFIGGKQSVFVQNVYYSNSQNAPAMTVAAPIKTANGRLVGVLAGHLDLSEMNAIIVRRNGLHETDDAFLVNTSNLFITQPRFVPDPAVLRRGVHTQAINRCLARENGDLVAPDYRDVPALIVYRWLPERELCLIVKMDQTEAFAPVEAFGKTVVVLGLLAMIAGSIVAYGLARTITRPVRQLVWGAEEIGKGNLDFRIQPRAHDEIGQLTKAFNTMAGNLHQTLDENARLYQETRAWSIELECRVEERALALKESEHRYRRIIETAHEGIWTIDAESKTTFVNAKMAEMLGYAVAEMLGVPLFDFMDEENKTLAAMYVERRRQGIAEVHDFKFQRKDGRAVWTLVTTNPSFDKNGNYAGALAMVADITDRKLAEELLKEKEHLLSESQRLAHIGCWEADLATGKVRWSEEMYRIFDVSPQDFTPTSESLITLLHPADQAVMGSWIAAAIRGDKKDPVEVRIEIRGGDIRYICVDGEIFFDSTGKPVRAVGTAQDITERIQAAEALQISEERFRSVAQSASDAIIVADQRATVLTWNRGAQIMFGYSEAEIVGKPLADLMPERYRRAHQEGLARLLATGETRIVGKTVELHAVRQDGSEFPIELALGTWKTGAKTSFAAIIRDITARKHAQDLLHEKITTLEVLAEIDREIIAANDTHTILRLVCYRAAELLHAPKSAIGSLEDDPMALMNSSFGFANEQAAQNEFARLRHLDIFSGDQEQVLALNDFTGAGPHSQARAAMIVLLGNEPEMRGALAVFDTQPREWSPDDVNTLRLLAGQASIALEKIRLFEEIRQHLIELESVGRVSSALRTANTLNELLARLMDEIIAMMQTTAGIIWLYQSERDELCAYAARGYFAQIDEMPIRPNEGIAGHVFATGEAYLAREFATDPRTRAASRAQVPAGWGGICLPIRTAEHTIGALFISVQLPREIQPAEVRLLSTLAEIAGTAVHRTQLHEKTERQVTRLASLRTIDQAISSTFDLRYTLDVILEHTLAQLNVDAASILLLNPHSQMLEYAGARGFRPIREVEQTRLRVGESFAGSVAQTRQVVHIPNLPQRVNEFIVTALASEGFAEYYGVPLIAKGHVVGVLQIFHRAALPHNPEWHNFCATLAGQAAIAIDDARLFGNLQQSNRDLVSTYDATIEGWSRALDLRDKETEGHTLRVVDLTLRLARAMGLDETELGHVRRGALLHDIGKMGVPDAILLKSGALTDDGWKIMRKHPEYAHQLLSPIAHLRPALDIPYCHHEKWDGTGYPRGLKGEQIPLAARIFAVVDVWDALTSDRPYRAAWSVEKTLEHIRTLRGSHFDPQVVDLFFKMRT